MSLSSRTAELRARSLDAAANALRIGAPVRSSLPTKVVLLGGSSSVGKTTLARELARRIDGEHRQVDDLRRTVDDPRVHFLSEAAHPWRSGPSSICLVLQRAAEAMRPVLGRAVDAALAGGRRMVLEGEALDPWLAERYSSDPRVSALFVVESDSDRLAQTLHARSPAFDQLSAAEQEKVACTAALYGRWLESESRERGFPCLASQPWATLADRATAILMR